MKFNRSYQRLGVTLLLVLLTLSAVLLDRLPAAADHACLTSLDRNSSWELGVLYLGNFCPTHAAEMDRNDFLKLGVFYPREFLSSHAALLTVSDQQPVDGKVIVDSAFSHGPGYIVIYGDYQGSPAFAVGHAWVDAGWSFNVEVPIATSRNLAPAYAILHGDGGQVGVYEFGMAWGADAPALVDGTPITASFKVYYPTNRN
jgi:hypothetical protein